MKLYMMSLLCSLYVRAVNSVDVAYNVTGPNYLVTDGTRKLTLTCQADTSSENSPVWFTPGTKNRCEAGTSKDVCTFTPRLEDDNQNVTCAVISSDMVSRAVYQVNLKYPPPSIINITIEPPQTEPLKQGDVITCTVSGGKPPVTNVTFHCQHPDHADREDDVSDDGRTVSSSVTVNTSQVNMNCTCFAHWDPEPELYDNITNAEFMLEYRATVTNFTVNGSTSKTVAESQKVMFWCQGAGRPSPSLILRKQALESQGSLSAGTIVPIVFGFLIISIGIGIGIDYYKWKRCNGSHHEQYVEHLCRCLASCCLAPIAYIGASLARIITAIQSHVRGSQTLKTDNSDCQRNVTPNLNPDYEFPADLIQEPATIASNAAEETNKAKPTQDDPGYASTDDIGLLKVAQRVAVSYNPTDTNLKSRSADKPFDVNHQPAEPAYKPQDDDVNKHNVSSGQGATSGPDPTYSHINSVNKNQ